MHKKGKVHPSRPCVASDNLSLLPAAILALAAALSAEDKQILSYLISCSSGGGNTNPVKGHHRKRVQKRNTVDYDSVNGGEHNTIFECNCFNCYLSYWGRWDISPNREVIHEIIEAYEEWLLKKNKSWKKKEKKNPEGNFNFNEEIIVKEDFGIGDFEFVERNSICEIEEKSMVRKITSFVGQKIWGFWGSK